VRDGSVVARTAWSAEAMPSKKPSSLMAGWDACVSRVRALRVHAAYNASERRVVGAAARLAELSKPSLKVDESEVFVDAEGLEHLQHGAYDLLPCDRAWMNQVQRALWSHSGEYDV
jgi:hypothetical protein